MDTMGHSDSYQQGINGPVNYRVLNIKDSEIDSLNVTNRDIFRYDVLNRVSNLQITTFTADSLQEDNVFKETLDYGAKVYASHRKDSHGNDYRQRSYKGLVNLAKDVFGEKFHAKLALGINKAGKAVAGFLTSNLSSTNLNENVLNMHVFTTNKEIVAQQKQIMSKVSKNQGITSGKDVLVVSPQDKEFAFKRISYVFGGNYVSDSDIKNATLTISSATLTSKKFESLAINFLKRGGNVEIVESGDVKDKNTSDSVLKKERQSIQRLVNMSDYTEGNISVLRHTGNTITGHTNDILMRIRNSAGDIKESIFYHASSRLSSNVWEEIGGTEAGLLAGSHKITNFLYKNIVRGFARESLEKTNPLAYEFGFTGYVNKAYISGYVNDFDSLSYKDGQQILIPTKTSKFVRDSFYSAFSNNLDVISQYGILTAAAEDYERIASGVSAKDIGKKQIRSLMTPEEYNILSATQRSILTDRPWGDSWNQLGTRGFFETNIINFFQNLNDRFTDQEDKDFLLKERFTYGYREGPVKSHSSAFADVTRNVLDFNRNFVLNLVGFSATSYIVSNLITATTDQALKVSERMIGSKNTLTQSSGQIIQSIAKGSEGLFFNIRYFSSQTFGQFMVPFLRAIDSLTGMVGHEGSMQLTLEKTMQVLENRNTNTAQATQKAMGLYDSMVKKNWLFAPFRFYFEGMNTLTKSIRYIYNFYNKKGARGFITGVRTVAGHAVNAISTKNLRENPHMFNYRKTVLGAIGVSIIIGVGIDLLLSHLGQNLFATDTFMVDAANRIEKRLAEQAKMHPVQLARTGGSNLVVTKNPYIDTAINVLFATVVNPIKLLTQNILEGFGKHPKSKILGINIFTQGSELDQAKLAYQRGNKELAAYLALKSSGGQSLYEKNLFSSDLWESWNVQTTANPMIGTLTWSNSLRRGSGDRNVLGAEGVPEEIREYGFTLQAPVFLTIGLSQIIPFYSYSFTDKEDSNKKKWAFTFKPGSVYGTAFNAAAFLYASDITWYSVRSFAADVIDKHIISHAARSKGPNIFAKGVHSALMESLHRSDNRFILNTNYAKKAGGAKVNFVQPMSLGRAVGTIAVGAVALPYITGIALLNIPIGLAQYYMPYTGYNTSRKTLASFLINHSSSDAAKEFANAINTNGFQSERMRMETLAQLEKVSGGALHSTEEEFLKHFGIGEVDEAQKAKAFAAYRRLSKPVLSLPNIFEQRGRNSLRVGGRFMGRFAFFTAAVFVTSHIALSIEAAQTANRGQSFRSSIAFNLANKLHSFVVSVAVANRVDVAKNRTSWAYNRAEFLASDQIHDFFQAPARFISGALHILDYQPLVGKNTFVPFRNLAAYAANLLASGLFIDAGLNTEDMIFKSSERGELSIKPGKFASPGLFHTFTSWASGIIKHFDSSRYSSMETHPYLAIGAFGLVQVKTDKDTYAWQNPFTQLSATMFLNAGKAQQIINRKSQDSRQSAESKYIQSMGYERFGLRVLQRNNPIRVSKMYHEDITDQASTWSGRSELLRRSALMSALKHVDSTDFINLPGFITRGDYGNFRSRAYAVTAKAFRNASTRDEAVLNELIMQLGGNDVIEKNKYAANSLGEIDSELEYASAVTNGANSVDYYGRKYYTPETVQYNMMDSTQVRMAITTIGVISTLAVVSSFFDPASITGNLVRRFKMRFFKESTELQKQKLANMRNMNLPVKAIYIKHSGPGNARDLEHFILGIGSGTSEELYVKGANYHRLSGTVEATGNAALKAQPGQDFGVHMWRDGDSTIHGIRRNLLRISGVRQTISKVAKSGIKPEELRNIHGNINNLANDLENMLNPMRELLHQDDLLSIQNKVNKFREATEKLNNLNHNLIKAISGDSQKSYLYLMNLSMEINGELFSSKETNLTKVLEEISDSLGDARHGLDARLIQAMERAGIIENIGPTQGASNPLRGNGFTRLMEKLGLTEKTKDDLHRILSYENNQIEVNLQSNSTTKKPSWRQRMSLNFENAVVSHVISELVETENSDVLSKILKDEDFFKAMQSDEGGIRLSTLEEQVRKAFTISDYEGNVDDAVKELFERAKGSARVSFTISTALKGIGSALKPIIPIVNYGVIASQANSYLITPYGDMGYLAMQAARPDLNAAEKNEIYREAHRASSSFEGGALAFGIGYVFGFRILETINLFRTIFLGASTLTAPTGVGGAAFTLGTLAADILLNVAVSYLYTSAKERDSDAVKLKKGADVVEGRYLFGIGKNSAQNLKEAHEGYKSQKYDLDVKAKNRNLTLGEQFHRWWLENEFIRGALDPIWRNDEKNPGMMMPKISYKLVGGSPSLDPSSGHSKFVDKSVFFVGNELDYGLSFMVPTQKLLPFQEIGSYSHSNIHSSVFGYLPGSKQVAANKDGSDSLGPTWMRNEYRSHLFHPLNLIQSSSVQIELQRKSELAVQIIMNLNSQDVESNKVFLYKSSYDVRSGVGMGDRRSFIMSTIDPTRYDVALMGSKKATKQTANGQSKHDSTVKVNGNVKKEYVKPKENITKTVKATPAKDIKQHAIIKIAKAQAKKIKSIEDKMANENKKVAMLVAQAPFDRLPQEDIQADTYVTQSKQTQGSYRDINKSGTGFYISSVNKFNPEDIVSSHYADTFNTGSDILFNDTV